MLSIFDRYGLWEVEPNKVTSRNSCLATKRNISSKLLHDLSRCVLAAVAITDLHTGGHLEYGDRVPPLRESGRWFCPADLYRPFREHVRHSLDALYTIRLWFLEELTVNQYYDTLYLHELDHGQLDQDSEQYAYLWSNH